MEIWKDVYGFEGYYQVSSKGRVKTLPRKYVPNERITYGYNNGKGYLCVKLKTEESDVFMRKVHRLVAQAFLLKDPVEIACLEVNHLDGDKSNNSVDNLEWVTHKENMKHAKETKLLSVGESNHSKLTEDQVIEIRKMYSSGEYTMRDLVDIFGVNCSSVYNIIRYKKWSYLKEVEYAV